MNDILKTSPYLITIQEQIPGRFVANSALNDEATANVLLQLAINFFKQSAIKKHEDKKAKQGAIINPHTMQVVSKKGN